MMRSSVGFGQSSRRRRTTHAGAIFDRGFRPVLTLISGWASVDSASAQEQDSSQAIVERIHREGGYPSDIQIHVDAEIPSLDDWDLPRWDFDLGLGGLAAPLAYGLLAVALIAIVGFIVFGAFRIMMRERNDDGEERTKAIRAEAVHVDPLLVKSERSAEEFAGEERYREAIHALFLRALERIGALEGRQRGRTAREIVFGLNGLQPGVAALIELLNLTELVWWGARPATAEQYRAAQVLLSRIEDVERRA